MTLIVLIGLAIAILGIALFVQGTQGQQPQMRSSGSAAIVAGLLIALLSQAFVVVPAGNVGVVFNVFGGVQENELGEGFHPIVPFLQSVTYMSIRETTVNFENQDDIPALSNEGLQIATEATVRYQIQSNEAARIYQERGIDYEEQIIRPIVRSVVRLAIANYNAADLIGTQRQALEQEISTKLEAQLNENNILLRDALLRNIRIPASITQAIEEKQAAEQQVQVEENRRQQAQIAAQRVVIEAEGERDAAIARAEGEAQALSLRGEAIRENPEIIQLEVAQRLAPSIQTIMLPSDSNFLLDVRGITGNTGN